jgi:hypothetical protein
MNLRLVVPKDRFLAQYLISSKLTPLTPERELQVFINKNNETNKGLKQIWVARPQQQTRYIQAIAC